MTLLVVSPDYASHLLPLATLATAWQAHGERVVVASGASTAEVVAGFGFERADLRLGRGSNPGVIAADDQPEDEGASLRGFFEATRRGAVATLEYQAAERLVDLMWEPASSARATLRIVEDLAPDQILVDHLAFSARLGLDSAGISYGDVVLGHPSALPVGDEVYGCPPTWPSAFRIEPRQLEELRAWAVLTLRSRMLAVIDVSGSMEEPAENGLRRIDIFQQAAIGAMEKFSGEVEMGVWVFSTARNGDLDYEDLSPIAPLADLAHKQEIAGIIQSLPARLGGATGLYDTTLAAMKRVRETYDPEKVNSVLLITDGKNEDENGIDLDTLLAELAKMDDPAKPVPVIMIGFGPDTDLAAMQRIAQATKGAAYSASRPEDLSTVLVDALSQRTCRPNCG
ncbi:VWA domain-containing protein [Agromyces humi]|uniref:VWA domain-containing protein n=1 Tax=Agromyces humi TaxID=1766800 RepID=UPI00135ACF8C|nr:VWA domain-containing protein [Agromyces humi]